MNTPVRRVVCGPNQLGTLRVWVGLAVCTCAWAVKAAEVLQGPIRGGFAVAEADRITGERKYALWGESATPLSPQVWEIRSPRLELYRDAESTNLVFVSERCVLDRRAQQIISTEPLRLWSGDGYLVLEGEGYAVDLDSRRLWVSNRVESVMDKRLFQELQADEARGAGLGKTGMVPGTIRVSSNRLTYTERKVEFIDSVRAEDAGGHLDCDWLGVELAPDSPDLKGLRAEGGVRVLAGDFEVTAQRATYDPAGGQLELEGSPRWTYRGRPGQAERVAVNRDRRSLRAQDQVQLEIPSDAFRFPVTHRDQVSTTATPSPLAAVQIRADLLEVEPGSGEGTGQRVLLRGGVQIEQGERQLTCTCLRVELQGTPSGVSRAEAVGQVRLAQGAAWVRSDRAAYEAEAGWAEFTGGVEWSDRGRSGVAGLARVDLEPERLRMQEGVRMRFEEAAESWAAWFRPSAREGSVEAASSVGEVATRPQALEIRSDRFEYLGSSIAMGMRTVRYDGEVLARQGESFQMSCEALVAQLAPETNRVEIAIADAGVELRATEGNDYRLARGDRAEYSALTQELVLTGREGVDFFVVGPRGVSRAMGRQAVYRGTTDTLVLAGDPAIATPEGELAGREVRLDRRSGVVSAAGPWRIRLPLGGIELPRLPEP